MKTFLSLSSRYAQHHYPASRSVLSAFHKLLAFDNKSDAVSNYHELLSQKFEDISAPPRLLQFLTYHRNHVIHIITLSVVNTGYDIILLLNHHCRLSTFQFLYPIITGSSHKLETKTGDKWMAGALLPVVWVGQWLHVHRVRDACTNEIVGSDDQLHRLVAVTPCRCLQNGYRTRWDTHTRNTALAVYDDAMNECSISLNKDTVNEVIITRFYL